ncbi:MAG: hypothetical protein IVW36_07570 [Dehalococcoidia bacterium]|nr:hypothetical protein [Dehalococcoidia bacterium]
MNEPPVTNAGGDVLCPNCRRFIPVEYDADFCVFGRHKRKEAVEEQDSQHKV